MGTRWAAERSHPVGAGRSFKAVWLKLDDGTEREFGAGDTFHMPPGHDAWIVGAETCVLLDFVGLKGYAQAT
jgi:quercetin dioxygenase-like cupin family protein